MMPWLRKFVKREKKRDMLNDQLMAILTVLSKIAEKWVASH